MWLSRILVDELIQQSSAALETRLRPDILELDYRHTSASSSNGLHRSLSRREV